MTFGSRTPGRDREQSALRAGNSGSNTVFDHLEVLNESIRQIPSAFRRNQLITCAGAGATIDLITHITAMNAAPGRKVHYSRRFDLDERARAITLVPKNAWQHALDADGQACNLDKAGVVELTALLRESTGGDQLGNWPAGMRIIARRERWRYQPFATNPAPRLLWMARVLWGAVGVLGSWCGEADVRIRSSGHVHPGCSAAGSPPTPISSRRWIRPGQFWRAAQVRLVQHLTSSVVGTSGPCSRRDASTTRSDPLNYQNTPSRRASNRATSAGEPGGGEDRLRPLPRLEQQADEPVLGVHHEIVALSNAWTRAASTCRRTAIASATRPASTSSLTRWSWASSSSSLPDGSCSSSDPMGTGSGFCWR
jgi:hypothetical protein